MVVDDSRAVRRRVADRLREAGLDVVAEAGSVASAMVLATELAPDGAVVDVKLPDGSGLELVSVLRRDVPGCVIVVITNDPLPSYRREALRLGADRFLDKSAQFDEIAAALVASDAGNGNAT